MGGVCGLDWWCIGCGSFTERRDSQMGNRKQMKWKALWLPAVVHSTHLQLQKFSSLLAQSIFKEDVSTGHLMFAFSLSSCVSVVW